MSARRDFGSFHASNVQDLVSIPEDEYLPPPFPFVLPTFADYSDGQFPSGAEAKKTLFFLEDSTTFLNHGAFGAVLKDALKVSQKWQEYIERQPLRFFDRELLPHLAFVTRRMAAFVGCDAKDLVLVPNATTATNTVLHAQKFKACDTIFYLSCAYGAVKKNVSKICEDTQATIQEEALQFPLISKSQILELVQSKLKPGTRLAIFDHIPSNTPFLMPVKELAEICHSRGCRVLIDGAHALGSVPLCIEDLGVDYYTTNAHKWFCAPKGAALLYVRRELQSETRPLIVSHGYGSGFSSEFVWSGLRDYSPFLALHTILNFHKIVGTQNILNFMMSLTRDAVDILTEFWQSKLLVQDPCLIGIPMLCVQLPLSLYSRYTSVQYIHAECIQNALYHNFNIEVPIKAVDGHLYVRISCHLHNCIQEFRVLAEAIQSLTDTNYLYEHIQVQ